MEADIVIVGAGSAGCAMAYRLSEGGLSVIVIEHGGTDAGPFIQMPAALSYPMNMKLYDWGYQSEPEPHLGGRRLATPRGKVIGGSSSINGMVYVRGHAHDYDTWDAMGASGWSYADVLPYFKRMEAWDDGGHGGDPEWRGTDGPLHVSRGPRDNPLFTAFVEAGKQAGYEATDDYNGRKQEGFGPMEQTVYKGRRWSAANAYLRPALKRDNCTLINGLARRVVIENGRAVGVEIKRRGAVEVIRARREVVIAASSINSPALLMHSGIGPAAHLAEHGIEVVADRPGVGQNLQDHLELYIQNGGQQTGDFVQALEPVRQGADWCAMVYLPRQVLGHRTNLRARRSSVQRRGLPIRTSSIISYRLRCVMTAKLPQRGTVSKRMWDRCGPRRVGPSHCGRVILKMRQRFCSTTCRDPRIGRNSEPASDSPARFSGKRPLLISSSTKSNRGLRSSRTSN